MLPLKIHHIGYLVKKIDSSIHSFVQLGYTVIQDTAFDNFRKVHICFMEKDGYVIELVSPADENSVVAGLLKKYKNTPYHICYEAASFEEDFHFLTEHGFTAIDSPTPAPAIGGRRVVFLMNASIGMIELLEAV
ncbi:MAG: lactoylglutathione lyase [Lachnospiraceae bacterium]|nr:lactoylglutathione lyase [Lachnospiraceae bacterium]